MALISVIATGIFSPIACSARAWRTTFVTTTGYVVKPTSTCTANLDRTASGTIAKPGTVAVDPRIFRLGTRFRIPGYGYGRAEDTGSLVIGHHIDLAFNSCAAAFAWGRRTIRVAYQ